MGINLPSRPTSSWAPGGWLGSPRMWPCKLEDLPKAGGDQRRRGWSPESKRHTHWFRTIDVIFLRIPDPASSRPTLMWSSLEWIGTQDRAGRRAPWCRSGRNGRLRKYYLFIYYFLTVKFYISFLFHQKNSWKSPWQVKKFNKQS